MDTGVLPKPGLENVIPHAVGNVLGAVCPHWEFILMQENCPSSRGSLHPVAGQCKGIKAQLLCSNSGQFWRISQLQSSPWGWLRPQLWLFHSPIPLSVQFCSLPFSLTVVSLRENPHELPAHPSLKSQLPEQPNLGQPFSLFAFKSGLFIHTLHGFWFYLLLSQNNFSLILDVTSSCSWVLTVSFHLPPLLSLMKFSLSFKAHSGAASSREPFLISSMGVSTPFSRLSHYFVSSSTSGTMLELVSQSIASLPHTYCCLRGPTALCLRSLTLQTDFPGAHWFPGRVCLWESWTRA